MKRLVLALALFIISNADFIYACKMNCAAVSCPPQDEIAKGCTDKGEAYVFPDLTECDCCGHCAPVKDVIDPKRIRNCDPTICPRVFCIPQDIKDCGRNQIYAPYDGVCFCCPACADKKRNFRG